MFQKLLDVFIFHEIEENFKAVAKNNSYEYASNRGDFFFFFFRYSYILSRHNYSNAGKPNRLRDSMTVRISSA